MFHVARRRILAVLTAVTFAVLPLVRLLDPKGPLAELQAKGYKVEAPE